MKSLKFAKAIMVALAACAALAAMPVSVRADDAQENRELKEQMRIMMQRMDDLQKQVQALSKQEASTAATAATAATTSAALAAVPVAATVEKEPLLHEIMKGFFGTLDVSFDDTTNGKNGFVAYHLLPDGSGLDYTNPKNGGAGPVGRVNYMPALSTNKSVLGYRGAHKIAGTDVDFIYQIETTPSITSAPGLNTSQYQQSNVVKGGIG